MKKSIIISTLLVSFAGLCSYAGETYSDTFINNLKTCTPFSENYSVQIPTNDPNTPVINLDTKETIVGFSNGKCVVTSLVYSREFKQDILTSRCAFNEAQRNELTEKMTQVKANSASQKQLQDMLTNYLQNNPEVCTVKNLLNN